MGNKQNRRRQMVIDRPVQSRIILTVSWPPAVALAFTSLVLGYLCIRLSEEALQAQIELPSLIPIFMTVMGFLLVASTYLAFNALKFSHRIAGPMYRIRKTLEAVEAGDLGVRAKLRDGDFLVEVAEQLNGFLDWLEQNPPAGLPANAAADTNAADTNAAHPDLDAADAPRAGRNAHAADADDDNDGGGDSGQRAHDAQEVGSATRS
jgi:hypothetical protein